MTIAASSTAIDSHDPSFVARFDALASEPVTCFARSLAVVTFAFA
jgi:hypothetical protein